MSYLRNLVWIIGQSSGIVSEEIVQIMLYEMQLWRVYNFGAAEIYVFSYFCYYFNYFLFIFYFNFLLKCLYKICFKSILYLYTNTIKSIPFSLLKEKIVKVMPFNKYSPKA